MELVYVLDHIPSIQGQENEAGVSKQLPLERLKRDQTASCHAFCTIVDCPSGMISSTKAFLQKQNRLLSSWAWCIWGLRLEDHKLEDSADCKTVLKQQQVRWLSGQRPPATRPDNQVYPQDPHDRGNLSPSTCPLTSTHTLCVTSIPYSIPPKKINLKIICVT